jgi:hypothetical protein
MAVDIPEIPNDPLLYPWWLSSAMHLPATGAIAEVFPRAFQDTHQTYNCIDMDGVDA